MLVLVAAHGRATLANGCLPVSKRSAVRAHPVSIIKGQATIKRDTLKIWLEVQYADDLELFHGLQPKEDGLFDEDELEEATEKHGEYLAENLQLFDKDGNRYEAEISDVYGVEVPDGGVKEGELMNYQLRYVLVYKFDKPPTFLTFQHTVKNDKATNPIDIDISYNQTVRGGKTGRFYLKVDTPMTREFNWSDSEENLTESEIDQWLKKEPEPGEVGIESYSSSFSYIYITDYEVRHELIVPLATLSTMAEFEREDDAFLTVAEQDAAVEKIKAIFSDGNPVTIDGVVVQPRFKRIDFFRLDSMDFAKIPPRQKLSMYNGRVGIIMSYSTKGIPNEVEIKWDNFNDALTTIDTVAIAYDQVEKIKFARYKSADFKETDENIFVWKNTGRTLPPAPVAITTLVDAAQKQKSMRQTILVVAVCLMVVTGLTGLLLLKQKRSKLMLSAVGLLFLLSTLTVIPVLLPTSFAGLAKRFGLHPELEEENARDVFAKLHKNMFRAFDYQREEDVYDALAKSVDGPLLTDSYLKIRKTLEMQTQGGAVSKIDKVELVDGSKSEPIAGKTVDYPGFAFRCRWNLVGSVEHWAHIHQRTNKYDAIFHVEIVDGQWKITDQQIVDEEQGDVKSQRRKLTEKKRPKPGKWF
jgi:hypothetical protein